MVTKRIVLRFPRRVVDRPIVYHLVKDYDLEFNILKASISPEQEGTLVIELKGDKASYEKGIEFMTGRGVKIEPLSQDIVRDDDRCTNCGACITVCPTHAFTVDKGTRLVSYDSDKCVACGACITACPPRAMKVNF
jgi:NAD-dependent dihydropyrimidine dehydrogenase PreA subunit